MHANILVFTQSLFHKNNEKKNTFKFGLANIIQANYNDQTERVINYNIGDFSKFQKSIEKGFFFSKFQKSIEMQ